MGWPISSVRGRRCGAGPLGRPARTIMLLSLALVDALAIQIVFFLGVALYSGSPEHAR